MMKVKNLNKEKLLPLIRNPGLLFLIFNLDTFVK